MLPTGACTKTRTDHTFPFPSVALHITLGDATPLAPSHKRTSTRGHLGWPFISWHKGAIMRWGFSWRHIGSRDALQVRWCGRRASVLCVTKAQDKVRLRQRQPEPHAGVPGRGVSQEGYRDPTRRETRRRAQRGGGGGGKGGLF